MQVFYKLIILREKNPKIYKKKFHFILTKNTGTFFFFLSCFHFLIFDDNEIHIYYW